MKAVIYARYSCENQTEKSIEGQIKENREFAKRNNIEIVDEYIDRAISGTKEERPAFQRMIMDAKKRQFNCVIVWKIDRFARDRYIFAVYKKELNKYGISVMSAMENIDTSTPEGSMFEGILESWAEYYSKNLSQNIRRGMRLLQSEGKYVGGFFPIGLKIDNNRKFIIDPDTAPYVAESFKMFANGALIKDVIDYLNKNNIKNCFNKKITYSSVTRMLRNKKYAGIYESGGYYFENAIEPIVDMDTFNDVQAILDNQMHKTYIKENSEFALSGKLICGECGSHIIGISGTSKTKKTHYYYKCSGTIKHTCKMKALRKQELEEFIANEIKRELSNPQIIETIAKQLYESYQEFRNDDKLIKSLEKQLASINNSLKNCMDAIEKGAYSESLQERISALETDKKIIRTNLDKAEIKKPDVTQEYVEYILTRTLENKDPKTIVELFVKNIIIYKDTIDITFSCYKDIVRVRLDQSWSK